MFLFGKKKEQKKEIEKEEENRNYFLGVEDTFALVKSSDIVVVGKVHGTIKTGDAIYISNLGDDEGAIGLTTVAGLEINRDLVNQATDCNVAIKVKDGSKFGLKTGTVIHSREASCSDVHSAYLNGLGEGYISFRKMKLEQKDYDKMSLTDIAEVRRLYQGLINAKKDQETPEIAEYNKQVINALGENMIKKILEAKELYVPVNKATGEPQLETRVMQSPDGNYITEPPAIKLVTKAYAKMWSPLFPEDKFELIKVEKGEDGKGIYNFLGSTFYLNGADGVKVLFDDFLIPSEMLVQKPDTTGMPAIQIPVTNPDVERWLLLIGQLGTPKTQDEDIIFRVYYANLFGAIKKARFLVPMKLKGDVEKLDDQGKAVIKKDSSIMLATQPGKGERDAIRMYTDWKRLRMEYPESEGWEGMVQTIDEFINTFDCVINATHYIASDERGLTLLTNCEQN